MEVPRDEASVCIVLGAEGATGVLPGLLPVALITAPRGLLKAGEDFESGHPGESPGSPVWLTRAGPALRVCPGSVTLPRGDWTKDSCRGGGLSARRPRAPGDLLRLSSPSDLLWGRAPIQAHPAVCAFPRGQAHPRSRWETPAEGWPEPSPAPSLSIHKLPASGASGAVAALQAESW